MLKYKKSLNLAVIDKEAMKKAREASLKKDRDTLEKVGAVRDTIMSLNPKYGFGHTKSYFKEEGKKEGEFIAHAFENAFAGNNIFEELMPDLYKDMVKLIENIKPE